MSRGQATTEYVALMLCIVLGVCLLVRTITPLEGLGMSLVHVFVPKRHPAPPKHPRKPSPKNGDAARVRRAATARWGRRRRPRPARLGLLEPQP